MPDAPRLWSMDSKGKLDLWFNPAQTAAWNSPMRFTFLVSGARVGKTSFGPFWLDREIKETNDPRGGLMNDYLAVTSTNSQFDNAMLPMMLDVFCNIYNVGRYWDSKRMIELSERMIPGKFWAKHASDKMWGRIVLRSAEAWQRIEGIETRGIWADECGQDNFTLLVWEAIERRAAQNRARVLGTTTPYNMGWLYILYDHWRKQDDGYEDYRFLQFPSIVNPGGIPVEEFERLHKTMPAWRFNMMYGGLFERPEGLIYNDFDEHYHWIDPAPLDPSWPTYVGLDFGPIHTAAVWVTERPDTSTYYLRQEYLEGGLTSPQHAQAILDRSRGMNVVAWAGGAKSEHQYRWDWGAAGVPVSEPLIADVEAGIDRVTALLKQKRLFVFNTCPKVRDEVGTYSRKLDDAGQPTESIKDKEKFHLLDATRYCAGELSEPMGISVMALDAPGVDRPPEVVVHPPETERLPDWYTSLRAWNEARP